jgi:hypothetical protein
MPFALNIKHITTAHSFIVGVAFHLHFLTVGFEEVRNLLFFTV